MDEILEQINNLKLSGMAKQWQALYEMRKTDSVTFPDGLQLLLQSEKDERQIRRTERLLKRAKFRYQASLDNLYLNPERGIMSSMLKTLATGQYIEKGEAVIITGATGSGKSFLASALGFQACSQGYKVGYYNIYKLLEQIKVARLEGIAGKFFNRIAKLDLLVVDDFGLQTLKGQQQNDLLEMIEDRHSLKSTIIVGQLPVSGWHEVLGGNLTSDAILDRIVHTAHRFELKSENSLRKL